MPTSFAVFLGSWIVLGIACAVFYKRASYKTKKAAHPIWMIAFGVIFLGFAEKIFHGRLPWYFVVAICVVMYLNYRYTQFCPQCNATFAGFSRAALCPRCRASLDR